MWSDFSQWHTTRTIGTESVAYYVSDNTNTKNIIPSCSTISIGTINLALELSIYENAWNPKQLMGWAFYSHIPRHDLQSLFWTFHHSTPSPMSTVERQEFKECHNRKEKRSPDVHQRQPIERDGKDYTIYTLIVCHITVALELWSITQCHRVAL